jgi:hypothetical protein
MANAHAMTANTGRGQIQTASTINLLLGVWLIIAPWVLPMATSAAVWNNVLFGALIVLLAATRLSRPAPATKAASWVNLVIGAWLIVAPFVLLYVSNLEIWNDIIVGALVIVFGAWSGSLPRRSAVQGA